MPRTPIYLDNHATTRVDPRVVEAMLPFFTDSYGNPASVTHAVGRAARDAVETARAKIAAAVGVAAKEIVFTSGATESNNLAIKGIAGHPSRRGRHLVSVVTEHPSVLEPLERLAAAGFEVTLLPVAPKGHPRAGLVDPQAVADALREDTILVSVMLANNEVGAIAPVGEIARICHERDLPLHSDATQAVGKTAVDFRALGVDLASFSAHKVYGPKGIGALYVRHRNRRARLAPLIDGGGHERGLRSGTLNAAAIVGFARAVELCLEELPAEAKRLRGLRNRLFAGITSALDGVTLNGPVLEREDWRLPGNLNLAFGDVDGESLLMNVPDLALSSGSACTSAQPGPSHVLRALGMADDTVRSSVRFGLGRFNTSEELDYTLCLIVEAAARLRRMASSA